jgi:hypothetical protein
MGTLMANKFAKIAFTEAVKSVQQTMGSYRAYTRREAGPDSFRGLPAGRWRASRDGMIANPSMRERMRDRSQTSESPNHGVALARGEAPILHPDDAVRILIRSPIGRYRVPIYLRGKRGSVETIIEPVAVGG